MILRSLPAVWKEKIFRNILISFTHKNKFHLDKDLNVRKEKY